MRVLPVENPTCAAFEEYKEVMETVPLDFMEDDVTWVASKISGLGSETIELRNWIIRFGCMLEEIRVVVAILTDWMANSSPLGSAYRALMSCCLVALDKSSGVRLVGIVEMLRRALSKLVMREAGDQAKTACGNLQLCAGLEGGIEGAIHAVVQRRMEREVRISREEEAGISEEK